MGLLKTIPDEGRVRSLRRMAEDTLEFIKKIDEEFTSNLVQNYYGVIRQLMSAIMLKEGFKTYGHGAHMDLIAYMSNKGNLTDYETSLVDDLRITRNKVLYDGYNVPKSYTKEKKKDILKIIKKLMLQCSNHKP